MNSIFAGLGVGFLALLGVQFFAPSLIVEAMVNLNPFQNQAALYLEATVTFGFLFGVFAER